jgi:hypothetical protein
MSGTFEPWDDDPDGVDAHYIRESSEPDIDDTHGYSQARDQDRRFPSPRQGHAPDRPSWWFHPPHRLMIPAESAESRPADAGRFARAWTRRPRPGAGSYEEDREEQEAAGQRPASANALANETPRNGRDAASDQERRPHRCPARDDAR